MSRPLNNSRQLTSAVCRQFENQVYAPSLSASQGADHTGLLFFYGLAKFLSICGWKGAIKRRGSIPVGRVTASEPIRAQPLPFWLGSCSPYESKSKYVLDVLKSREKTKISLSRSCLPGSRAAKFQSPGDVFVNFTASFVQSAPDWESGHGFRPVQSLPGAGLSPSDPPAGSSANPTPNGNQD